MRRLVPLLTAAALLLPAAPARAAWEDWVPLPKDTEKDDLLLAVDVLSPSQFVLGGISFKVEGGILPLLFPVLYRTQDGGQLVQSIKGNVGGGGAGSFAKAVQDLAFRDLSTGWAALGGSVWRTTNAGGQWQEAVLAAEGAVNALARFDANTGVAVGAGGQAWRTQDGGATWKAVATDTGADLMCLHFADGRKGWAAGAVKSVSAGTSDTLEGTVSYGDVVVLWTSDGGASWKVVATVPPEEADGPGGKMPCPLFFLDDLDNGWLALSRYDQEKGQGKEAVLLRTRDGGKTWTDTKTDFRVGTFEAPFVGKVPLPVSYVAGMHWSDGTHGHLVGAADTMMSASDGGGGGDKPIFRSVDMSTSDGKAWDKTDIGTFSFSGLGGGTMPTGDPRPTRAEFTSRFFGVLVGEKGKAWTWRQRCVKQSECAPDGTCDKRGADDHYYCYPSEAAGPDGAGDGDAAGDRDAWAGVDLAFNDGVPPVLDVPACEGDGCPRKRKGGGCAGGPLSGGLPGAWPTALVLGLLLAATRRLRP